MSDGQKPSIGRIVHYYGPSCLRENGDGKLAPMPAIITHVRPDDGAVCLTAFGIYESVKDFAVPFDPHAAMSSGERGYWCWPPRAP